MHAPSTIAIELDQASQCLSHSDSPRLDAEVLLAHVLGKARSYLYAWPEKSLSAQEHAAFSELIRQRKEGVPVAYLTGTREFFSLELAVNEHTLIPRPATETLVESALSVMTGHGCALDLGTGSGAVALALAHMRPQWSIVGIDQSAEALTVAQSNRERLKLANVEFLEGHWFTPIETRWFELIVSNPPYIDAKDRHLSEGDVRYEPRSALVSPEQGLADLQHIIFHSRPRLAISGWLMVEHGCDQSSSVQSLFRQAGYRSVTTVNDFDNHPRVTKGQAAFNE